MVGVESVSWCDASKISTARSIPSVDFPVVGVVVVELVSSSTVTSTVTVTSDAVLPILEPFFLSKNASSLDFSLASCSFCLSRTERACDAPNLEDEVKSSLRGLSVSLSRRLIL